MTDSQRSHSESPQAGAGQAESGLATTQRVQSARSFLFVPGDRPERFDKAVASGADVVIIDLEDAVAPESKARARAATIAWLAAGGQAAVRVNAADSPEHAADLQSLAEVAAATRQGAAVSTGAASSAREEAGLLAVVTPR